MNQIICTGHSRLSKLDTQDTYVKPKKRKSFLKMQFLFLVILVIALILYYLAFKHDMSIKEELSKSIAQSYRNNKDLQFF